MFFLDDLQSFFLTSETRTTNHSNRLVFFKTVDFCVECQSKGLAMSCTPMEALAALAALLGRKGET